MLRESNHFFLRSSMWVLHVNFWSKVKPRNFAWLEKRSRDHSMCSWNVCTFLFLVNIKQLVFGDEKLSPIKTLYSCKLYKATWSIFLAYTKFLVRIEILRSSAYNRVWIAEGITLMMLLIKRRKQYKLRYLLQTIQSEFSIKEFFIQFSDSETGFENQQGWYSEAAKFYLLSYCVQLFFSIYTLLYCSIALSMIFYKLIYNISLLNLEVRVWVN